MAQAARNPERVARNACVAGAPLATRDAPATRTLIIGVGNPDRADDGAGVAVARRLRAAAPPGVVVREASGEATALIDAWDGFARVIVIDAARSHAAPGTVTRFDAVAAPLPASLARESTHGWGLAEAIELARALGRLPPALVVYAIEGHTFEPGDALSPGVARAVARLAATLTARRPAAHAPATA